MELLNDCPLLADAGYTNIIFTDDPSGRKPKGFVYRISKLKTKLVLVRYDVEEDEWEQLAETKMGRQQYLTLMPIFSGRFITILGDLKLLIYDVVQREWISVDLCPGSHPIVPR